MTKKIKYASTLLLIAVLQIGSATNSLSAGAQTIGSAGMALTPGLD